MFGDAKELAADLNERDRKLMIGFGLLVLRFAEILVRMLRGEPVRLLGDEAEDALAMQEEMKQEMKQAMDRDDGAASGGHRS